MKQNNIDLILQSAYDEKVTTPQDLTNERETILKKAIDTCRFGKVDLLWENASKTSQFAPQKISLDLSKYNHIIVLSQYYSETLLHDLVPTIAFKFGRYKAVCLTETGFLTYRSFYADDTGVTFESGYIDVTYAAPYIGNHGATPDYILGVI